MKIIKIFCTLVTGIFIILLLSSCTPAPPTSSANELVSHKWILVDSFDKSKGSLSFSDGRILFDAQIDENTVFKLNEEYIIDEEKITVASENYGILVISYKISGNRLSLSYTGNKIILKKE